MEIKGKLKGHANGQVAGMIVSPINMDERMKLDLRAGDTVKVHQKIKEANGKTRIQMFEGLVLARRHGGEAGGTFTVRRTASGVGVEKIFPMFSPNIDRIEVTKRSKVRRAKLFHIREKAAKEISREMRHLRTVKYDEPAEAEVAAPVAEAVPAAKAEAVEAK